MPSHCVATVLPSPRRATGPATLTAGRMRTTPSPAAATPVFPPRATRPAGLTATPSTHAAARSRSTALAAGPSAMPAASECTASRPPARGPHTAWGRRATRTTAQCRCAAQARARVRWPESRREEKRRAMNRSSLGHGPSPGPDPRDRTQALARARGPARARVYQQISSWTLQQSMMMKCPQAGLGRVLCVNRWSSKAGVGQLVMPHTPKKKRGRKRKRRSLGLGRARALANSHPKPHTSPSMHRVLSHGRRLVKESQDRAPRHRPRIVLASGVHTATAHKHAAEDSGHGCTRCKRQ